MTLVIAAAAAGVGGCAGRGPLSGMEMLDDLERAQVSLPDEGGRAAGREEGRGLPASGPIRLADLLVAAEASDPEIGRARSAVGVAIGQAWQASRYPNPRGDVTMEDISGRDGVSSSRTTVGLTQSIIVGKRREAAMDAASAERAAREAEVEAARWELCGRVVGEHSRLVAIREERRLYGELRRLVEETLGSARARFEAKAAPETDVIRPRVELYRIEAVLGRLEQERIAGVRRLSLLVGGIEVDDSRLEGEIETAPERLDVALLESGVLASHPALAVAEREIEAAAARFERVKAEVTPDVDVRVAGGYDGGSERGVVDVGAGVTIPLWDRREGDVMSARFEIMRARQRRAAVENDVLGALASVAGEYEASRSQLEVFRDQIVPDAQRAFDQAGEGYRAGRSSFLELLDAQRTLTEARATLAELASAVAAARAKLIQVVGPAGAGLRAWLSREKEAEARPAPRERPRGAEVRS